MMNTNETNPAAPDAAANAAAQSGSHGGTQAGANPAAQAAAHAAEAAPQHREPPNPDDLMELAARELIEIRKELAETREKWLRAEAEAQNIRARAKREIEEARLYAVQKFAADVVEAAENLRRGLSSLPEASEDEPDLLTSLRNGFEGTERSFIGLLERNGIAGTDPTGTKFDPNLHQAMQEQPCADVPPGTVLKAWSRAWTLHGRLLKPAMVVVAKADPGAAG